MDEIKINKNIKKDTNLTINLRESVAGSHKSAIEWQAPAFKYYPKDVSWYWMSFIIAILIMAFAIWQKNFFFAVFIFLAEILVLILARRQPELIKFKIDDKGLTIADKTYQFNDLEKFCLRPDSAFAAASAEEASESLEGKQASYGAGKNFEELILKRKTHFNPYLRIFVDVRVSSLVRQILSQKSTEEEYEDSLIESIFKWLRF